MPPIHLQKPVDPNLCWTFLFWFFTDIWLKPQARIYGNLSMFTFTPGFQHRCRRSFEDMFKQRLEFARNFNYWIKICVLFVSSLGFLIILHSTIHFDFQQKNSFCLHRNSIGKWFQSELQNKNLMKSQN